MPWFPVDDSAHMHPKLIAATNAGLGLWLRCGSYAAQHLTDGIVPGVIAKMYGTPAQVRKLVAAGLWHEHGHTCSHPKCPRPQPGDYAIHDYLDYNPTRAEVERKRERAAEKKRRQRAGANQMRFEDDPHGNRDGFDDGSHANPAPENDDAAGHGAASPGDSAGTRAGAFPSPPLPSPSGGKRELSLIPADWQPSDDDVRAAQLARTDAGRPQLTPQQLDAVTRKFVRRMAEDQVRAAGFGGRWQQWAENERNEQPAVGGNVVQLGAMTRSQQQRAGLEALRQQMNGGQGA